MDAVILKMWALRERRRGPRYAAVNRHLLRMARLYGYGLKGFGR